VRERIEKRMVQNISVTALMQSELIDFIDQEGRDQERVAAGFACVTPRPELWHLSQFFGGEKSPTHLPEPRGASD
jgi:hypothetical protein